MLCIEEIVHCVLMTTVHLLFWNRTKIITNDKQLDIIVVLKTVHNVMQKVGCDGI